MNTCIQKIMIRRGYYQLFKSMVYVHLLIVPRLFEEKWRDIVFGFPWGVVRGAWRVARGAWCVVPSF